MRTNAHILSRPPWWLILSTAVVACGGSGTGPDPLATRCDVDFGDPATSKYVLPFQPGETYRLIQGNCPSNPDWGHYGWFAYDFDLATGDTVVASRAGRVRFVQEDRPNIGRRCGMNAENFVILEHDDGSIMFYVHLDTEGVLPDLNDRVEQGEPIGISGNSGCSSGPHLHVMLFDRPGDTSREASRPFNYANADGPVGAGGDLVQGADYTALSPPAPGARRR